MTNSAGFSLRGAKHLARAKSDKALQRAAYQQAQMSVSMQSGRRRLWPLGAGRAHLGRKPGPEE
jgi:hypothetical protein